MNIDNFIKNYENEINAKLNTDYNYLYIQPYHNGRYGVIFNGQQIALCDSLRELEQVKNTILFFIDGGIKQ